MAKKRGNNEGSIHQRKNGSWRAQISLHGRRLSRTVETKREAQDWLRKMQEEVDQGLTFENTQLTVDTFLREWLVSVEPSLRYNTHKQYRQIVRQHILPLLGKMRLRDVRPDQIQRLYNGLLQRGLSARTTRLTHAVLHRALVHAVKLGILPRNPAEATMPPKPKRKEMKFLDENQALQLLIAAKESNDRFYALYHLAIATGMRQGELLGLKWADLDIELGMLQVQRQLTMMRGGGFGFTAPKTKAGTRRIDLGQHTLEVLQDHRQQQFQETLAAGSRWEENDLIFPSTIGTPMNRDNLRKRFKLLLKLAGLPKVRFHDLRHSAASLMLNNGIPVIVVSKRLGHAQPSITLDVYGHLIPTKQQEAAVLMDQLLTPIQFPVSK
jgi:integrase